MGLTIRNPGTRGAKVQSWRRDNPRDLLQQIVVDNPGLTRAEWLSALRHEVLGPNGAEYVDAMIEYWFSNNLNSLLRPQPSYEQRRAQREATKVATAKLMAERGAVIKDRITKLAKEEARVILMDTLLPNGKKLGDATGAECMRFGGFYVAIGRETGPRRKVRAALTEERLHQIHNKQR